MEHKFNPCPLCGFEDIYCIQEFDSLGLEHWSMFCNNCKTSFQNEHIEDYRDQTINWWNSLNSSTSETKEEVNSDIQAAPESIEWKATWSGEFPCLCNGEWTLYHNNQKVEVQIPFQHDCANTYGEYMSWHFTADWSTVDETYFDGLLCDDWIQENKEYLTKVTSDTSQWALIFKAFSEQDWRSNSCGGCA